MRKLKYHENKLLKKVNLYSWKSDGHEALVCQRFQLVDREDYVRYRKLWGRLNNLLAQLKALPQDDPERRQMVTSLLDKLYDRDALRVQSATQFATRENQLKTEFNAKADLFEKIKAGLISRLETVENAQQKVILSRGRLTFELESAKTKMQQLEVVNLDLQKKCSSWQSQNEVLRADLHQMQEKAKEAQDLYEQLDQYAEIVDRLREEIDQLSGGL